jgi:Ca2+-binding RTX toxin-like protein
MVFVLGTSGNNFISPFSVSPGVLGIPGAGADTIDGGAGADTMDGGDGNDTYIVDNVGDIVKENFDDALGGIDTVLASVSYSLAPGTFGNKGFGIENLTLTGSANINATGNAKNNVLIGNGGNNILDGGAGNDTINGSNGNDTINGGAGVDTANYNTLHQALNPSKE